MSKNERIIILPVLLLFLYCLPNVQAESNLLHKPDLALTAVVWIPKDLVEDHGFTIFTFSVKNQGNIPANVSIVKVFVDGKEAASEDFRATKLNPGGQMLLSMKSMVGRKFPVGTHVVRVLVDATYKFDESNEGNNALEKALVVHPASADLTLKDIKWTPPNLTDSTGINLVAVVKNAGRIEVPAGWDAVFYVDGKNMTTVKYDGVLGPNAVANLNLAEKFRLPGGVHVLKVVLDPANLVPEYNESNNEMGATVSVSGNPKPDLIIDSIRRSPGNPRVEDEILYTVNVKNSGQTAGKVGVLAANVDGNPNGTVNHMNLQINASQIITIEPPSMQKLKFAAGNHTVKFAVDANNKVSESDENNNGFTDTFRVREANDTGGERCRELAKEGGYMYCNGSDEDKNAAQPLLCQLNTGVISPAPEKASTCSEVCGSFGLACDDGILLGKSNPCNRTSSGGANVGCFSPPAKGKTLMCSCSNRFGMGSKRCYSMAKGGGYLYCNGHDRVGDGPSQEFRCELNTGVISPGTGMKDTCSKVCQGLGLAPTTSVSFNTSYVCSQAAFGTQLGPFDYPLPNETLKCSCSDSWENGRRCFDLAKTAGYWYCVGRNRNESAGIPGSCTVNTGKVSADPRGLKSCTAVCQAMGLSCVSGKTLPERELCKADPSVGKPIKCASIQSQETTLMCDCVETLAVGASQTPSARELPQAPAPEPKASKASIYLSTTPGGASAYIDDEKRSRGITPLTIKNLVPGNHTVKLVRLNYHTQTKTAILEAGQNMNMSVTLKFA